MDDLENYAEYGHASILYLILESLHTGDMTQDRGQLRQGLNKDFSAASHVGVCAGICTLLRGIAYHNKNVRTISLNNVLVHDTGLVTIFELWYFQNRAAILSHPI